MTKRSGAPWRSALALGAAVVVLVGGGVAAGLVAAGSRHAIGVERGAAPSPAAARRAHLAALADSVSFQPAPGATGVGLDQAVTVTVGQGQLTAVTVTGRAGVPLPGVLSPAAGQWQSAAPLAPGTVYRVVATVREEGGLVVRPTASFTTVTPTRTYTATLSPGDGETVGVGEPVAVIFSGDVPLAAQPGVISHLSVAMSQVVPGGWHWFSPHELHFRPLTYWPTGERVRVTADLAGWDVGGGAWGEGAETVHFTVGPTDISTANLSTDHMVVTRNGKVVWDFPFSGGRTQYPTMDGVHIAMDKAPVVHMVSSTVGIPVNSPNGYDEYVYSDVHISDSGEYVHAAPWSVSAQGVTNVSHGCINLSPADAAQFYAFTLPGDVIDVIGGPRPPAYGDHGVMDWTTPWSQWAPATVSAL